MSVSDDKRREVAAKLREKKKDFFGVRSFFPQDIILYRSLYMQAIDECLPDGDCCFDVLADLIDRPMTRNVATDKTQCHAPQDFACKRCGYWAPVYTGFLHCPGCGAEVMRE